MVNETTGWWFQTWLLFSIIYINIWDVILPIDELIFFRGVETTNQIINLRGIIIQLIQLFFWGLH